MLRWEENVSSNNYSAVDWIMLKFRPIAPKPVGGETASGAGDLERKNGAVNNGARPKRKYARVRGRQSRLRCARKRLAESDKSSSADNEFPPEKATVTLQLLPERLESDGKSCDNYSRIIPENRNTDRDDGNYKPTENSGDGRADLGSIRSVIETWISVELVTDTFMDTGVGLGFSDNEKIYNLEKETCPGFISDHKNNVIWVNEAYKKLVAEEELDASAKGFLVWLVVKDELPKFCPSFACRVRLIQHKGHGQKWNRILPCDVWRMEFAGFAWKLDVNTALSLGL